MNVECCCCGCFFVVLLFLLLLLTPFVAGMSTEFHNTFKNETHFSNISICTS